LCLYNPNWYPSSGKLSECVHIYSMHNFPVYRDVALSTVKTGMSGKAGNKGAVGVRMIVQSSPICFVCAHMTAHQSHVNERNSDFTDIWRKMTFPNVSM